MIAYKWRLRRCGTNETAAIDYVVNTTLFDPLPSALENFQNKLPTVPSTPAETRDHHRPAALAKAAAGTRRSRLSMC
jgi:hypothetical protein